MHISGMQIMRLGFSLFNNSPKIKCKHIMFYFRAAMTMAITSLFFKTRERLDEQMILQLCLSVAKIQ